MEKKDNRVISPNFNDSFSNGWDVMKKYFLVLLLVVIFMAAVTAPLNLLSWNFDHPVMHPAGRMHPLRFDEHSVMAAGALAVLGFLALAYSIFVLPVFAFGGRMMFLQAVRNLRPDINLLVKGFRENYLNIILAGLLKTGLVIMGFIAFIVPGIIIACRLAFVSYLVMDKKMDPVAAVENSWKMTKGLGWTIFFMGFVSFFICIGGLILLFIGIFPAIIWIASSFSTLYETTMNEKGMA
jgi:hypothetical protein